MYHWFGVGLVMVVSLCCHLGSSSKLPGIYWNKTSERFRVDSNDHIITVNLNDDIDIYCPYYPDTTPESEMEYYVIYQVNKKAYEECSLQGKVLKLINCSRPQRYRRYTIIFTNFGAIPNSPQFEQGASYYFITTSTGSKYGMDNPLHGACQKYQMKVRFNVCCGEGGGGSQEERVTTTVAPTTTTVSTKPAPVTKPSKPEETKPVKNDNYGENEALPKDQRQVGDHASTIVTSSQTLFLCSLFVIYLHWLQLSYR